MSIGEQAMKRVVEPAVIRFYGLRGDPVARWLGAKAKRDPFPVYEAMRARGLSRSALGIWSTSSHVVASSILRDGHFSASPVHAKDYRPRSYPDGDPRGALPDHDMLTMDPPDHTRLRRLTSRAFSRKAIMGLEPWIRERVVELLDQVDEDGFDLISELAFPLPIAVICHILGVPPQDQARFRIWGHEIAQTLEPQLTGTRHDDPRSAELALTAYLHDLVDKHRSDPDESLLSALVAVEEEGDHLSSEELVSTALLLLVAGFETTVNLIGNGTSALLGEPEQWARMHQDPDLVPGAVEEMLRYDPPVHITSRTATQDAQAGGREILKGESVLIALAGSNRDPEIFDAPNQFAIDRENASSHLSFSQGIHHCLGPALARLEAQVAFEELTGRYPQLRLAGRPVRRDLLVLRGFEHLPVRAS